jgi:hypothetical protein
VGKIFILPPSKSLNSHIIIQYFWGYETI